MTKMTSDFPRFVFSGNDEPSSVFSHALPLSEKRVFKNNKPNFQFVFIALFIEMTYLFLCFFRTCFKHRLS